MWFGPSSLSASWFRCQEQLSGQYVTSSDRLSEQGMWFPQLSLWTWEVPGVGDVREDAREERVFWAVGRGDDQSQRSSSVWHQHHPKKMLFLQLTALLAVWGCYKLLKKSFAVSVHGTCGKRVVSSFLVAVLPIWKWFHSWIGLWHRSSLCFGCWPQLHRECT